MKIPNSDFLTGFPVKKSVGLTCLDQKSEVAKKVYMNVKMIPGSRQKSDVGNT